MVQVSLVIPWKSKDDQYFVWVQKRETKDELEGLWEFAGGKKEYDESLLQAAQREFFEEVGVDIEKEQLFKLPVKSVKYKDKAVELNCFCYETTEMLSDQGKWMKINRPADYFEIPKISREIIIDLLNYIKVK